MWTSYYTLLGSLFVMEKLLMMMIVVVVVEMMILMMIMDVARIIEDD